MLKIALGHSLGGNTKQVQQLVDQVFDKVYTINDAPPTFYQLAYIDSEFRISLARKFNIDPLSFNEIYTIDPAALKEFAEEHYKEAGANIQHLTANEDLLHAVSLSIRGFIEVGEYKHVDTISNMNSIAYLLQKIPDEDIQAIQVYFSQYASVYNTEGFDAVIYAITGADAELVKYITELKGLGYAKLVTKLDELIPMIQEMRVKVPELLKNIEIVHGNLEPILTEFVKLGYLTEEQMDILLKQVEGAIHDLEDIVIYTGRIMDSFSGYGLKLNPVTIGLIGGNIFSIIDRVNSLSDRFTVIKDNLSDILEVMGLSGNAHSIYYVIKALGKRKGKEYTPSNELIVQTTIGDKEISVNISTPIRIYLEGMAIYDEKESVLNGMKQRYEIAYLDDYETRKNQLISKIEDMESNPYQYQHLLGNFSYDTHYYYLLKK